MPIYCDESGFTGNDALNVDQPYFSYASVNIGSAEAADYLNDFRERHKIKSHEIKGSVLLSRPRGRDAVQELLFDMLPQSRLYISQKLYSLCGRFFEYVFEPLFAGHNGPLYYSAFNQYIAVSIYASIIPYKGKDLRVLIETFEAVMRHKVRPEALFTISNHINEEMMMISEFMSIHQEAILKELDDRPFLDKWILDDTFTALWSVLSSWTEVQSGLEVICDESKPLADSVDVFKVFIGRNDKSYYRTPSGEIKQMLISLDSEIVLKKSIDVPGLQIADVLASSLTYAAKNAAIDEQARDWVTRIFQEPYISCAVGPDIERFSDKRERCFSGFDFGRIAQ